MNKFEKYQRDWNEDNVEIERYKWLTEDSVIRDMEMELLSCLPVKEGYKVLEVGCGEGQNIANLMNLHRGVSYYGVDMSGSRIVFAKQNLKDADLRAQDGRGLDYEDNVFDLVFCRDVLHHMIEGRDSFIMEMYRVCKKNGKVMMVESNGLNIINALFSMIVKKESEMKKITPHYIEELLGEINLHYTIKFVKGFNTQRLIFHYKYGLNRLASTKSGRYIYDFINLIPIPKSIYSYMIIEISK